MGSKRTSAVLLTAVATAAACSEPAHEAPPPFVSSDASPPAYPSSGQDSLSMSGSAGASESSAVSPSTGGAGTSQPGDLGDPSASSKSSALDRSRIDWHIAGRDAAAPESDAMPPGVTDPDATAPTAGPDAATPTAGECGALSAEALEVAEAGTGAFSGCAPKTCSGIALDGGDAAELLQVRYVPSSWSGCTTVQGSLVFAGHPGADLTELACLERVQGDFVIWNNPGLRSLHGLESLAIVEGDLGLGSYKNYVTGNVVLARIDALSNLRVVRGDFKIGGGAGFESLAGLESLEVIGGLLSLQYLYGASDLSGMNSLVTIGDHLSLITPHGLTRMSGLRSLRGIGGHLVLWGATEMTAFDGLPSLECVGLNIDIGGDASWEVNPRLERIGPFPSLRRVGFDVLIDQNPSLRALQLFDAAPVTVEGSIRVTKNATLATLPVTGLDAVGGQFVVSGSPLLPVCSLREKAAELTTQGWAYVADFSGDGECP